MTRKSVRFYIVLLTMIDCLFIFYWLLPISGKLAYIPDSLPQTNTWPQISVVDNGENMLEITVQAITSR